MHACRSTLEDPTFIITALIDANRVAEAETLYQELVAKFGITHDQVSNAALALAKSYDQAFIAATSAKQEAEALAAEHKSAKYFYDFAQSGRASPDNLLNIGKKFRKVGDNYWDSGDGDLANEEYTKEIWCYRQYLAAEQDAAKRAAVEEDLYYRLFRLGRASDLEECRQYFERYVEANPRNAAGHLVLGQIYLYLQNFDAAYDRFGAVITGVPRGSATWVVARYCLIYCLAHKNPTPQEVSEAQKANVTPGKHLGQKGLALIADMRELGNIDIDQETKKPLRMRDPDDPTRRVRDLGTLWKNVEADLRKRK